jgi:membrane protease subunit (stomatin/prohibitin family)
LGESKIAALDLASNYDELAKFTREKLNEEFKTLGLELTKFVIENISLPQDVEAAMDKRTSMGVIGDVGQIRSVSSCRCNARRGAEHRWWSWNRSRARGGFCNRQCDGGRYD